MTRESNIAIVIPVYSDTVILLELIDRIHSWADQPREILVVSGSPDEKLNASCAAQGCRYLETEPCRGAQLDAGARAAAAGVMWFLHADAVPYPSSLGDIALALAEGAEAGHFRFKFAGPSQWRKEFFEGLIKARIALGGIPYGDQGIFVRREAYFECGGFLHQPLFEEVSLVKRLRKRGSFRALDSPIGVSPRRWENDGWIRRSIRNRQFAMRYKFGTPAEQLAEDYALTTMKSDRRDSR